MKTIEADRILTYYVGISLNKTMREIFLSIPKNILLKMRKSYEEALKDDEIVGDNMCSHCHHLHNDGIWTRGRIKLFLERITQTIAGNWI